MHIGVLIFAALNFGLYVGVSMGVVFWFSLGGLNPDREYFIQILVASDFTSIWLFYGAFASIITAVLGHIAEKGKNKPPPSQDEIFREDDVLLQAAGFSQAALFIALSFMQLSPELAYLRWMILAFAIPFYILRAYAKIKNNSKYRYYSMYLALLILITTISAIFVMAFAKTFNTFVVLAVAQSAFYMVMTTGRWVSENLRIRYGVA